LNILLVVTLSAACRIFLKAFRGDGSLVTGGLRQVQLDEMVGDYYWMRKGTNLETLEE
jgi:hypothetical protein